MKKIEFDFEGFEGALWHLMVRASAASWSRAVKAVESHVKTMSYCLRCDVPMVHEPWYDRCPQCDARWSSIL